MSTFTITRPIRAVTLGLAAALAAAGLSACGTTTASSSATTAASTAASTSAKAPSTGMPMDTGMSMGAMDPGSTATATAMSTTVHLHEAWVKAADSGMTALFGVLENHGSADVTLVRVVSTTSTMLQLHETVSDGNGGTKMQQKQGGFLIKANGGQHVLAPGHDHIMLMGLTGPLKAGSTATFTLIFSDQTKIEVTAPVRTYNAAQESYAPGATSGTGMSMTPGMTMGNG